MKTIFKAGIALSAILLVASCRKESIKEKTSLQSANQNELAVNTNQVKIGTQIWMKKDLTVSNYRNGDRIPQVKDPAKWASLTTGAWCWYNNDPRYGKLYNWYAVADPRGLAPEGWHVPGDAEWTALTVYLGGFEIAGGKMKETGTTHWLAPNAAATNSSGFTALPGGSRYYLGQFFDAGGYGYWWSSTQADSNAAFYRYLTYFYGAISGTTDYKTNGFSVRCIKD
ncbi:fibrobacter succinogenes major paralogous domain-containing protein [Panacibacter sp. DH6]|uniref:Fibrobacter succinogenes major paralogous domain-containing protein n=1 Tax=Panacibacter microcysteis TaxID=2793269 RepID=A0A931GUW7_9BACT|nr:fibrobacter succinogenes major paralogous domain-containing protein [Panacibacter microcysteis]MBG9375805.1 fibrobacter succinogenes major paralogous domain-containing protein [Panacibacter microcysteis]